MMNRFLSLSLLILSAISAQDSLTVFSDTTSKDKIFDLNRMVVTATRTNRLASTTPASVSIITENMIELAPAKNVDDLLQKETSVQIKRVAGMSEGIPSDIIIRGIPGALGGARTLILVDGIPTNAAGTPFLILNEIPLAAIKKVEIVRGPYSSLYGANAFSGVINIITKDGTGKPSFKTSFETSFPFSVAHNYTALDKSMKDALNDGASDALWNVDGLFSMGSGRVSLLINGGYRNIGNYLLSDSAIARKGDDVYYKSSKNHEYSDTRFFGKLNVGVTDNLDFEVQARFFNSDMGFGITKKVKPNSQEIDIEGTKFLVAPKVNWSVSDNVDLAIGGFYRHLVGCYWNEEETSDTTFIDPAPGRALYSSWTSIADEWQADLLSIITLGSYQIVTAGIEYIYNDIDFGKKIEALSGDTIPWTQGKNALIYNVAIFVQDEISFLDRYNIVPGFRFDYHSGFGFALSPKLGISILIASPLRFHGSVGRAFRAPNLTELYMPPLAVNAAWTLDPNPDLDPEYIWAFDAGIESRPVDNIRFDAVLFYNKMRNLIGKDFNAKLEDGAIGGNVTHQNISSAWSRGFELSCEYIPLPWLQLVLNGTIQNSHDEFNSAEFEQFADSGIDTDIQLDYIPRGLGSASISANKKFSKIGIEFQLSESFVGRRKYLNWDNIAKEHVKNIDVSSTGDLLIHLIPDIIEQDYYFRTDFALKFIFPFPLTVAINLQNLFNVEHEESPGTLAPGRFASMKFSYSF